MFGRLRLCPSRCSRAARGIFLFLLAGCGGSSQSGLEVLTVEIKGLPEDLGGLQFKIHKADCLGRRPCDTWLAQGNISQATTDTLPFRLQLPEEIMSLVVHLRIETTVNPTSCIGTRATTTDAKPGAHYAGASLAVSLDRTSLRPPFSVSVVNACPFFYEKQGTGDGTILLQRASASDITIASQYPDELPRATYVTATAMPGSGSRFTGWSQGSACEGSSNAQCEFYVTDVTKLIAKFDPL